MFKKLRNRLLVVNLVIFSIIMLVAFAAIYTITYNNTQNDIRMDLSRATDSYHKINDGPRGGRMGDPAYGSGISGMPPKDNVGMAPIERSLSFMAMTDKDGALTGSKSQFEVDDELLELALGEAWSSGKDTGQFTLDGSRWAFSRERSIDGGYMFVFLDVSAQQKILTNLIYTFLAVALAMLIVIFFVSRYFANRSIAPIKEAFDKQKQFIADASHELKTPLTIINTNTDVLLANSEDTIRNQSKWLHYIKSETERMTKLTNDLLFLTQMDDTREELLVAAFDISDAIESIILTMEAVVYEKRIRLDYEIEPHLTMVGSSEQIKQVVMILLDNAIKYTKPEGSVSLSLKKQAGEVVLSVTNTGDGIAPEHLTRIFDRFYRTDSSRARKQGGYGLGLAIAKSIVERHKGRIVARSVLGESTSFSVYLPRKNSDS
ncbi:sensor histidine kinase [Cohnella thailandensis]|uniref:histidine kinase n=1 Tax=Cohnella thailandensis TaxID=557557 RepID=A0A841SU36_9BACL|nr:HAMP domain-containing sensor histidine kinase [Cohnella thailandensis]MBB6633525.1 GHKL domain-containing protein [Cohnella thailandensis]MBP1974542.1 signal transduction histidine kinase [Cohnella thailandensis]